MALMQQFETTQTSLSTQASLESSATVGNNGSGEEHLHSIIKDPFPGRLDNNNELAQEGMLPGHISLDNLYVSKIMESSQYDTFNLQFWFK